MSDLPLINWYPDLLGIILLDLAIAIGLLASIRKLAGLISHVSSTHELSQRDNLAFGIAFAGGMSALAIMLTGAISGDPGITLLDEALLVLSYGLFGIVLMALTRHFLDKISLPEIAIHEQIMQGNVAAAIVDAANMIATAIIVRAVMVWVDDNSLFGLFAVISGFVFSQIVLVIVTRYRTHVYAKRHHGESLQKAFAAGNRALATRYFGHKVGVALAVTAASGFVPYNEQNIFLASLMWGLISIVITVVLSALAIAARYAILAGINVVEEVDQQQNMAVATIEAVIYMAIGLLLAGLIV